MDNSCLIGVPFQTRLFDDSSSLKSSSATNVQAGSSGSTQVGTEPPTVDLSNGTTAPSVIDAFSADHYPISFRSAAHKDNVLIINKETLGTFLLQEYSLERLEKIHKSLWVLGLPRPARSLTTKVVQGLKIVLTNNVDMHLVWTSGKVYLKPLPRYLLEPEFWTDHLSHSTFASQTSGADANGGKAEHKHEGGDGAVTCGDPVCRVRQVALGLLYSYAYLVSDPSDFQLAVEQGLIPLGGKDGNSAPDWVSWRKVACEILAGVAHDQRHERFQRAELRLGRLNLLYFCHTILKSPQLYNNPWNNYSEFISNNFGLITASTVYVLFLLTAFQTGLATSGLHDSRIFNRVSSVFAVVTIAGTVAAIVIMLLVLLCVVVYNWLYARKATRYAKPKWSLPKKAESSQARTPASRQSSTGSHASASSIGLPNRKITHQNTSKLEAGLRE